MEEINQPVLYMIFALGLVLLVLGFALSIMTQEISVANFPASKKETTNPYQSIGILVGSFGILLIVGSMYSKLRVGSRTSRTCV